MTAIPPTNILASLGIGARALLAQQTVLNTIGHNLANATTPGYSRQRAELQPGFPQNGVDVAQIRRVRDRFLDVALLNEQAALGRAEAESAILQRLQGLVNDPPGSGLSAVLDQFYQSLHDLSGHPTDQAIRVTVADRGQRLAATFQGMSRRLDELRADLTTEIQEHVAEANGLLSRIAEVQRQIAAGGTTRDTNDFLDRRDQLVSELSRIVGVSASDRPDGTVQLALAGTGVLLVDGVRTAPLAAAVDPLTDTVVLTAGTVTTPLTAAGGALAAALTARNAPTGAVNQAAADLDTLAAAIVAETNRVHASGTGLTEPAALTATNAVSSTAVPLTAAGLPLTPATGTFRVIVHDASGAPTADATISVTAGTTTLDDLATALDAVGGLTVGTSGGTLAITADAGLTFTFAADTSDALAALGLNTFFTGSSAGSLALNPLVSSDVTRIAAARADAGGLVHPGDGSNALALARLRTTPVFAGAATFTDFYGRLVSRVGARTGDAAAAVDHQGAAVQVVRSLQQQVSGVSTDEELVGLTQAQTAYAAAARYITTMQAVLDSLLEAVR